MDSVFFFDETNDWEEGRRWKDVDRCRCALRRKDLCRDEMEFIINNPFFSWKYQKPSN